MPAPAVRPFPFLVLTQVLVLALATSPVAAADADPLPPKEHEVVTLADGVYGFVWSDPFQDPIEGNALFIVNDRDVLVVDTGIFPSTARTMAAELRKLTDKPVRYVVNTHWHDDHHQGNQVYRELWPEVEFVSHRMTRQDALELTHAARPGVLAEYEEQIATVSRWAEQGHDDEGKRVDEARRERIRRFVAVRQQFVEEAKEIVATPPELVFDDALILHRGERTIEVRFLGVGNTRGDVVVFLPKERIVASGDLLVHPAPFAFGSNYREWAETLDALDSLDAEVIVPGHGPVLRDRTYLHQVRDLLRDLVAQVDAAVDEGLSLEQTQERVTLADWKTRFAAGDEGIETAFDSFFVQPAVKRAWEIATGVATPAEGVITFDGPTPEDGYYQEVRSVASGVWVLLQPRMQVQPAGNVTVIEQQDGLVLVDTGGSPGAGRRVVETVKGLSPEAVKAVIVTHWHGDHALGLTEIQKAWPEARTIATRATQEHLQTPKTMNTPAEPDEARNRELQEQLRGFGEYSAQMAGKAETDAGRQGWAGAERLFHQYVIDMDGALTRTTAEGFTDRLVLDDPRSPVEVRFLGRANTDGDAVVWLPKQRVVVTGDVVVAPIPYGFGSYPGEWTGVLEAVKSLDFAVLVPGHGAPQTDATYLDRLLALLEDVREQVAKAGPAATLEEVRAVVDLSHHRKLFAGDDPWLAYWFDSYWTQPIVASAYKEAHGEPIVQSLR